MAEQRATVANREANSRGLAPAFHDSRNTVLVPLLIMAGALARILSYVYSDNSGGDAWTHLLLAAEWLRNPRFKVVFDAYPPGHFWLIGLTSLVVPDVVVAGRILSLVLGIASLWVVWKLARILYGESAALFSLAAFCFYSLHIGYSTTSSAEVSYLFFLLAGLLLFFVYTASPSPHRLWYVAASGVLFSISESIRFEAWIVFGGAFILLPYLEGFRRSASWYKSLRGPVIFGAAGGAWPAFMMAYCWRVFHDPMFLVHWNKLRVVEKLHNVPFSHQLTVMPLALLISASPFAVAAGIYGLARSLSRSAKGGFTLLTLFFAAIETYELLTGGLLATPRYSITLGSMLIIVAGYGFDVFCHKIAPERMRLARAIVIALLVLNSAAVLLGSELPNRYANQLAAVSPRLRYHPRIAAVAGYLRRHMGPNDSVVIDDYNVESDIIAAASGLPIPLEKRAYLAGRKNNITVHAYIAAEHPRFLVYSDEGTLRDSLTLTPGNGSQIVDGVGFRCVFANEVYRVYELSYP